jgi:hypothetical protein
MTGTFTEDGGGVAGAKMVLPGSVGSVVIFALYGPVEVRVFHHHMHGPTPYTNFLKMHHCTY